MTTLTEEDRRARDWQARQRRIEENQRAAEAKATGNPALAQAVRDNWEPVILALREVRNAGDDDPDCEDRL
jgi:hypothetical protein